MSKEMEEAAEAEFFNADCPYDKQKDCLRDAFKSGWKAALRDSPEVRALVEALEWYGAHSTAREALAAYQKSVGV